MRDLTKMALYPKFKAKYETLILLWREIGKWEVLPIRNPLTLEEAGLISRKPRVSWNEKNTEKRGSHTTGMERDFEKI